MIHSRRFTIVRYPLNKALRKHPRLRVTTQYYWGGRTPLIWTGWRDRPWILIYTSTGGYFETEVYHESRSKCCLRGWCMNDLSSLYFSLQWLGDTGTRSGVGSRPSIKSGGGEGFMGGTTCVNTTEHGWRKEAEEYSGYDHPCQYQSEFDDTIGRSTRVKWSFGSPYTESKGKVSPKSKDESRAKGRSIETHTVREKKGSREGRRPYGTTEHVTIFRMGQRSEVTYGGRGKVVSFP